MSDYMPKTGEILTAVVIYRALSGKNHPPPRIEDLATSEDVAEYVDEFERWLSARDAEVRRADRTLLSQVRAEADELRRQGYPAGVLLRLLENVTPLSGEN